MRWDSLRLADAEGDDSAVPLFARGAVARTFDTPEFKGMTFYEIQARSIINKVPAASRVPFSHTINPYRGCSHACSYCLAGDTPVLMADGRAKPIAELRAGDRIFGTRLAGGRRRLVVTEVLDHWSTVKAAHRVTLADGTRLVASGEHRFLTERGWKHVTGEGARPFLGDGDRLVGCGRFAAHPHGLEGAVVESAAELRVVSVEPLGVETPMYDITTGTGDFIADGVVSHNCFARKTHEYLDLDAGHDFDSKIVVKVNAAELARKELASPRWGGHHVAMGTNVDCYQRAEGRYQLMPGILRALTEAANPFSILTKGTLILRDLPLLVEAARVSEVSAAFSVGFVDERLWRAVEPGTPHPGRRLEACRRLTDGGIACGVLMAPILPYLSDSPEQLEAAVREIAASGATHVTPIVLHLRPGAREWFLGWLSREHPRLVPRYLELYGRGAYAPKAYQERVSAQVRELARQYGIGRRASWRIKPDKAPPPEQLSLL
ncbi:Rv2578c family radical SAM protein [Nonomuraea dietziae]|uniref:Rv2578c family radical SAM protein n=1 Tax=Nonomuraea dietziae TaxID=65515 RepID=UPI00340B2EEF